jgi:prophage regulatory protein
MTGSSVDRIVREREVRELTGTGRTTRWRWERDGCFPARVYLGPHAVGWRLSEIEDWLANLPRDRADLADRIKASEQNPPNVAA